MMDLQRIRDELEITAVLNRYARAVDTKDWQLYCSIFTDDAVIDDPPPARLRPPRRGITNIEADLDGDTATHP